MNAIEVQALTKRFGVFRAVDHISFGVKEGEVFGFLGPNGSGELGIKNSKARSFGNEVRKTAPKTLALSSEGLEYPVFYLVSDLSEDLKLLILRAAS